MTFKEDFKPTKVYNKLVNDACYNADCLEEFEKQRLVVANPLVRMLKMIVRMLKMIVKVIVLKIVYIGVLMRLVSITPGHVKLDWLPPPKVDRVNDNNSENNNE